ncbi:DUF4861 family protein [Pedobacter metabolipauper]|uniref:Uncharacterized protein DUF4861 n=1 Tax=Pedobacter metabolipauper TaxID=425513 RepID=A0A4R6T065_9SPHI|nr:DUF4861 family protein [Pedobacter metabolipauper]TDQ10948.1 uncharacterized protein DUF4861 [Pedobacter metabolipauper]
MKKSMFLLLWGLVLCTALTAQTISINLTNPGNFSRNKEVVSINWKDLVSKDPKLKADNFKVIDAATKKEVPFQLEYKGLNTVQNLLVQVTIGPDQVIRLTLIPGKPSIFPVAAFGRYVPERMDDFAWENDKMAFRAYGKALESTKENAFGMDVWAKRTDKMIINDWYKTGDYHKDHGDGLDYYSVGFTLGAGDIAPYINQSIIFSKNYRTWKVLDQGPLRFTFQLGYEDWNVDGKMVKVLKTILLDAGSQLNRVEAVYSFSGAADLPVVMGIVKRKDPGSVMMNEVDGIMGYWEPQHGDDGTIGVGVLSLQKPAMMSAENGHLLTHSSAKNGEPVVYYSGAAWSKSTDIKTAEQWFRYLNSFQLKLEKPVVVRVQ